MSTEIGPLGQCVTAKRSWPSEAEAQASLDATRRCTGPGVRLRIYHCHICGQWHKTGLSLRKAAKADRKNRRKGIW